MIDDGDFSHFAFRSFDLILCAFAFDNIPNAHKRAGLLRGLSELLRQNGRIVLVGSTPEIYTHEWVSFTTKGFPQNRFATSGDPVRIVMTDVDDQRPVVDFLWFHEDYLRLFTRSGLEMITHHKPLGRHDEPQGWHTELTLSPWVIYVLARAPGAD